MTQTIKKNNPITKASLNAAFMLAGTAVGAGMLAIPVETSQIGFMTSFWVTIGVWLYMLLTGLILMKVSVAMKGNGSFLEMAGKYLPFYGKEIIGFLFVFLYGTLMIGYISAANGIIGSVMGGGVIIQLIFPLALLALLSMHRDVVIPLISKLTLPMVILFVLFYVLGAKYVQPANLMKSNLSSFYIVIPVLFGAFGYHNIVPTLCRYLRYDTREITFAILFGSFIPCLVYLLWQGLILGILDSTMLEVAKQKGVPAVVMLGKITGNSYFGILGTCFAFFAILTSVLGVGISLVDFLPVKSKRVSVSLTVLVPFAITLCFSGIFFAAQRFAGGFGEALLNGMIPVALYYFYQKAEKENVDNKNLMFSLLMIGIFVIVVELKGVIQFCYEKVFAL